MAYGSKVSVCMSTGIKYPENSFDPPRRFPEYPHAHINPNPDNTVYTAVRDILKQLRLDADNYDTPDWNPLSKYIRKGDRVVIKPNFVTHEHPLGYEGLLATVTNPSLVRAIIDYAWIAAGPEGRIDIIDAPLDTTDFDLTLRTIGAAAMLGDLRGNKGLNISMVDLRKWRIHWVDRDVRRFDLPGVGKDYVKVDLEKDSELLRGIAPHQISRYRSTADFFQQSRMKLWHNEEHNVYSIAKLVLESNAFINIPKMKTHKKAGVTLNLKNIFGVTEAKDTLPHHRIGSPLRGGDEIPDSSPLHMRLKAFLIENVISNPRGLPVYRFLQPFYGKLRDAGVYGNAEQPDRGEWHGNDTVWRTVLDLNKVLLYADAAGKMHDEPQRSYFSVVDGIVAGEGNGPLKPSPFHAGAIVAGDDPVAVDLACVKIMGLDWKKIPTYANVEFIDRYGIGCADPELIQVVANGSNLHELFAPGRRFFSFRAPDGWRGAIEL